MKIYPGILTDSVSELTQHLGVLQAESQVQTAHIDIIDGSFVDNITVAPLDLAVMSFGELTCDLHLMVDEPMDFVFETEAIKERVPVRALIAQVEHMSFQTSYLEEVRVQNWKAGLSLDLYTPLSAIDEDAWKLLDVLQIMSVQAGYSGQVFQDTALEKISEAREEIKKRGLEIELIVDGGIALPGLAAVAKAGATAAVATSTIWNAAEPASVLLDLIREGEVVS